MPTLSQLGDILTASRIATPERWQRAAKLGAGDLAKTLDAIAAFTPDWWVQGEDGGADAPPGLTDYQRGAIEHWFDGADVNLPRQLAINQFILLEKLGQGGQGEVFRARQLNPSRYVAVKTLTQDTETGRQRFEQEARAMVKVHHPSVARFHLYERVRDALGKPTDEYLIAMEYVEGTDLHRVLHWIGPVQWRFVVRWAIDLLGGLGAIHESGFVHRDIKPANVMILGPTPEPGVPPSSTAAKLLDFGAVKTAADAGATGTGNKRVFIGTREYAPPEQWAERVVPASDIYALGCALFYAVTGRPPYVIPDRDANEFRRAHTRAPIPDARTIVETIPPALSRLLTRMLAKAPENRGTPAELIEAFRELLPPEERHRPSTVAPHTRPTRPNRPEPEPAPQSDLPAQRQPTPELPEHDPLHRVVNGVFGVFERIYLPPHLRPAAGHEPPLPERLTVLLRRPLLLITIAVLVGVLVFILW
jgi:serine/threonine protein kinase